MSIVATRLPASQKPGYLTAYAAALAIGISPPTVRKHLQPDAWVHSGDGRRMYPLYLTASVEAYVAGRQGGAARDV